MKKNIGRPRLAQTFKHRVRAASFGAAATLFASLAAHAAAPQADAALIVHGEYLARAGDCIACHSAPSGKPFAVKSNFVATTHGHRLVKWPRQTDEISLTDPAEFVMSN